MQTKHCTQCDTTKPVESFTKSIRAGSYKLQNTDYHSYCKVCNAARARELRKAYGTNYRGTGKLKNVPVEDRYLMSAIRARLSDAKARCRKLNKPLPEVSDTYLYNLFLNQNRKCALTGTPLLVEKQSPVCLSLDQIDPSKGYIEGNVQWLAWAVNRAKGDLSLEDFYDMCSAVLSNRNVQRLS